MINGIYRGPALSGAHGYNRNAATTQTDMPGFQNRLIDKAINSNNSLNGQHVVIYMNCLVSQVSGGGQELHMKYDESSTDENPVIYAWGKDSSGKAFETKIFVNDIDPHNASPAEMKALHAHLARQEGGAINNSIPIDTAMSGYDINQKIDFVQYLEEWHTMQELANNPAADLRRLQLEQYLAFRQQNQNAGNTISQYQNTLTKNQENVLKILDMLGVNLTNGINWNSDGAAAQPGRAFNGLDVLGPSAPDNVKDAWIKAEAESGANGYGMDSEGKFTQITALFAMSVENMVNGKGQDVLGSTVDSAKAAVQKALDRLGIPQDDNEKKEKLFYEAFLRLL